MWGGRVVKRRNMGERMVSRNGVGRGGQGGLRPVAG